MELKNLPRRRKFEAPAIAPGRRVILRLWQFVARLTIGGEANSGPMRPALKALVRCEQTPGVLPPSDWISVYDRRKFKALLDKRAVAPELSALTEH
jgi:hypothetical protein